MLQGQPRNPPGAAETIEILPLDVASHVAVEIRLSATP
jgi:hypothetical protein